jgi:hypothetical protein
MTSTTSARKDRALAATWVNPLAIMGAVSPDRRVQIVSFLVGFVLCGLMSVLVGQDNNWDLQNYHYYNPYAFLNDRMGYDVAPAQRQTYLNPFLDLPFYWGTRHLTPRVLGFLMGGIHGLAIGLTFSLCMIAFRRYSRRLRIALSAQCAAAGVYAPVFLGELGASQNDTLLALVIMTSLIALVRKLVAEGTLAGRASRRTLLVAALMLGLATGLKATVMPHIAAFAVAVVVVESGWRKRVTVLAMGGVALLVGFLVANGYWMFHLWREFENPFFPFYNDVFKSAWADPRSYADRSMVPQTALEAFTRPFMFGQVNEYTKGQNSFRDLRYAILYVVLALYTVVWLWRRFRTWRVPRRKPIPALPIELRFLLVFFLASFVAWEAMFSIIRYTAALELLAPVLIVVIGAEMIGHHGARVTLLAATSTVIILASVRPIQHERVKWGEKFWEVQVPTLPHPQNSIIILANTRPWAYLIPAFPREVRWLSVDNNLTSPKQTSKMQDEIKRILAKHDGEIYLLSQGHPSGWYIHDQRTLAKYRLRPKSSVGQPITSKHSRPGLQLWRLYRY